MLQSHVDTCLREASPGEGVELIRMISRNMDVACHRADGISLQQGLGGVDDVLTSWSDLLLEQGLVRLAFAAPPLLVRSGGKPVGSKVVFGAFWRMEGRSGLVCLAPPECGGEWGCACVPSRWWCRGRS